jgi:uncharacterized membrane protein YkvA (DUF1232 family)
MLALIRNTMLIIRLFFDSRVPWLLKAILPITLVYAVIPTDLVPDFLVGPGWLDDIIVLIVGMAIFLALAPKSIVREHLSNMGRFFGSGPRPSEAPEESGPTIEGSYRIVEDDEPQG